MDALSHVLKSVRLEGAVYLNAEFTAPWCVNGKPGPSSLRRLSDSDHVISFHYVAEGRCKVRAGPSGDSTEAEAGDLVLFPGEEDQYMGSTLRLPPADAATALAEQAVGADGVIQFQYGGGGEATRMVCGYIACSRSVCRPLLEALPRVMCIPMGDGSAASMLRELLRVGVRESTIERPGAGSVLAKLSELMFVDALRRYVESLPPGRKGWLAGVRDPRVGRALALLHAEPERTWTVDELAREAALSRSALAERFAALVGEPPMQYLTRWRLALAAQMLRSGEEVLARVSERSGYESEAAFSRAFKREFGMPPAAWRKSGRQGSPAA